MLRFLSASVEGRFIPLKRHTFADQRWINRAYNPIRVCKQGHPSFQDTENKWLTGIKYRHGRAFSTCVFPENPYLVDSQTTLPMARSILFLTRLPLWFFLTALPLLAAGQSTSRENEFMDCLRQGYPDAGASLGQLMEGYEAELIGQGLLSSSSSDDYRGLLQRLASGQRIEWADYNPFSDRFQEIAPDSVALKACKARLENFKATNPEATLTRFLDRRDAMIRESIPADMQASALLDILGETELDEPFYRLHTYYLIDLMALPPEDGGLGVLSPYGGYQAVPEPGANIMQLYLNERNQILLSDQLITPELLTERVLQHARRFGPKAWYIIAPEPDVKFSSLQNLQDRIALAITQVRDQYARSVLGKTWIELSPEERTLVAQKFPLHITLP